MPSPRSPPTFANAPHRCQQVLGPCSTPHRTLARYAAAAAQTGRPLPVRQAGKPACGRHSASQGPTARPALQRGGGGGGGRRRHAARRWCPVQRSGACGASCRHHGSRPASWHCCPRRGARSAHPRGRRRGEQRRQEEARPPASSRHWHPGAAAGPGRRGGGCGGSCGCGGCSAAGARGVHATHPGCGTRLPAESRPQ